MDNLNNTGSILPISALIALLAVTGYVFSHSSPFQSTRQDMSEIQQEQHEYAGARLWQDPFSAVLDHINAGNTCSYPNLQTLSEEIRKFNPATILGVMIPCSRYDEGKETRIRLRYAVLNALQAKDHFSRDPDRIEYAVFSEKKPFRQILQNSLSGSTSPPKLSFLNIMPYEWQTAREGNKNTLVIWLNEEVFRDKPLHLLSELVKELEVDKTRFHLIGPQESETLVKMLGELKTNATEDPKQELLSIRVTNESFRNDLHSCLSKVMNELGIEKTKFSLVGLEQTDILEKKLAELNKNAAKNVKQKLLFIRLNDESFLDDLHSCLSKVIKELGIEKKKFDLFCPEQSDTLKKMLDDLNAGAGVDLAGIKIYSAFATAPDRYLTSNGDAVEELFNTKGINFSRIMAADDNLAVAIAGELKTRGVRSGEDCRFLIISETDTLYSHSLRDLFSAALTKEFKLKDRQMRYISYFRGLDGSVPGQKTEQNRQNNNTSTGQDNGNGQNNEENIELAQGQSQYDYIRRSMDRIHRFEERRNKYLTAIIILGNDFNDKSLILQAARQSCPQALCFTTGFDARWAHPKNFTWSRNFIIASYYIDWKSLFQKRGQDVHAVTLRGVPPFRDDFQASAFLAVLRLLNEPIDVACFEPTIFEIGRYHAIDLTHKMIEKQDVRIMIALLLMVLLLGVLFVFKPGYIHHNRKRCSQIIVVIVIAALFTTIATLLIRLLSQNPCEELFSLIEGVSIWPNNILNIVALVVSIYFLWSSNKDMKSNNIQIRGTFFKQEYGSSCTAQAEAKDQYRFCNLLKEYMKTLSGMLHDKKSPEYKCDMNQDKQCNIIDEWKKHEKFNTTDRRIVRIVLLSLIYFVFCVAVVYYVGPAMKLPVRGEWSANLTKGIMGVSGFVFVVLMIYVFDATSQCRYFIAKVSDCRPDWKNVIGCKQTSLYKRKALNELRLARLIALRTQTVMKLIYYPLIIWSVLVIARSNYFDYWHRSLGVALATSLGVLVTWLCAVSMRRAAENYRRKALLRLRIKELDAAKIEDEKERKEEQDSIDYTISRIENLKEGSFVPFMQQPVFRSILIGLASLWGSSFSEFLNIFNF